MVFWEQSSGGQITAEQIAYVDNFCVTVAPPGCTTCGGTVVINDDFSGDLSAYTFGDCFPSGDQPNYFTISGGKLIYDTSLSGGSSGAASLWQAISRPSISGLCISIEVDLIRSDQGPTGIFIEGVGSFFARHPSVGAGQRSYGKNLCTSDGCGMAGDTWLLVLDDHVHTEPERLRMVVREVPGGTGIFDLVFCVNDEVIYNQNSVSLTIPASINVGVTYTVSHALGSGERPEWDNLLVVTS